MRVNLRPARRAARGFCFGTSVAFGEAWTFLKRNRRMQPSPTGVSALQIEGTVCAVDTINRELVIRTSSSQILFDVPSDCTIGLRSERVKLRMVQPLDRIKIVYVEVRGLLVARSMEVQPRFP